MLTMTQALEPLARRRTNEAVVATMSSVRHWGLLSRHPLDFASADSAMGHAADLALGIAMAQPGRRVFCLNGDGSMLMTLGSLVTIVEAGAKNLVLIVMNNGAYEITGRQAVAGAPTTDFAGMALAAGFTSVHAVGEVDEYDAIVDPLFSEDGPTFVELRVEVGDEGPISRGPHNPERFLQVSIHDSARVVKQALAADPTGATP